eukprot:7904071-Pyramimonas_sp.AAC.1
MRSCLGLSQPRPQENARGVQEEGVQEECVHIMARRMCAVLGGGRGRIEIGRGAMKSGEISWPPP